MAKRGRKPGTRLQRIRYLADLDKDHQMSYIGAYDNGHARIRDGAVIEDPVAGYLLKTFVMEQGDLDTCILEAINRLAAIRAGMVEKGAFQ